MAVLTNLKSTIETKYGSQLEFAPLAQIHPVRLSKIVRGHLDPTAAECARISKLLGVDSAWLFKRFTIPTAQAATTTEATLAELSAQICSAIKRIEET